MSEFENPNLPENLPEKRIEVVTMRVGDIKTGFGNPRKIGKKKREELKLTGAVRGFWSFSD